MGDNKKSKNTAPSTKTPSTPKLDIKPTIKNRRRYAALLYAGVTAISIATMLALVGLKPRVQLSLKSRDDKAILPEVTNLIAACQFPYHGCNQPEAFVKKLPYSEEVKNELNAISQQHNLNPQLLVATYLIKNQATHPNDIALDTKKLKAVAQQLRWRRDQTTHTQPVLQHPLYGSYKLNDFTQESYALIEHLAVTSHNEAAFKQAIEPPKDDGKVIGFIETYNALSPK